jgi:WD40 repeat protein
VLLRGHTSRVTGLALGGVDGDIVASCGADRVALLWDARRGVAKASFVGHAGALTGIATSGESSGLIATTGADRTVRFWDARSSGHASCVRALRLDAAPAACASAGARQPHWFATCGADGVCAFDARVWREVAHFAGLAPLTALAFHGESKLFAGDADGRLYALDVWKAPPRSWE